MPKKAQMFIITAIFLTGLVSSVQQLIFQYTAIDLSVPFRDNSVYLLRNTNDIINKTIINTPDCADFSAKMQEFRDFLDKRIPRGGYSLSMSYRLNCTDDVWDNSFPDTAPLNLSIQITGNNMETSARIYFYHTT